jgi:hypothetical protein
VDRALALDEANDLRHRILVETHAPAQTAHTILGSTSDGISCKSTEVVGRIAALAAGSRDIKECD